MKEIKAYIRRDEINEVVEKLQATGAPGASVIEIIRWGMATRRIGSSLMQRVSSTGTDISRS